MHKGKYNVKPLSDLLTSYVAKNDKIFSQTEIDALPDFIKDSVNIEREKDRKDRNSLFIYKAFKDLEVFNRLNYTKKFNFNYNIDDKIYFMYKLRDNPLLVKNTGYTKYSFVLEIINGETINHDSIYKLHITETATGEIGLYETTVGRFD
jgi:hypothetical protein